MLEQEACWALHTAGPAEDRVEAFDAWAVRHNIDWEDSHTAAAAAADIPGSDILGWHHTHLPDGELAVDGNPADLEAAVPNQAVVRTPHPHHQQEPHAPQHTDGYAQGQ